MGFAWIPDVSRTSQASQGAQAPIAARHSHRKGQRGATGGLAAVRSYQPARPLLGLRVSPAAGIARTSITVRAGAPQTTARHRSGLAAGD
ncbi:MAG: hypothetical protein ACLQFR_07360 [Streptosporangiaceae bacterium]